MTFTGGTRRWWRRRSVRGGSIVFTGPMAPDYGDLTSHGFFVPFVSRVIEYLSSDLTSLEIRLFAGQTITRSVPSSQAVGFGIDLVRPDSTVVGLSPEEDNGTTVVRIGDADRAGIYHLAVRGREIDRFAVNIDPAECDLTPVDPDQLAASLGSPQFRSLGYTDALAESVARFRVGRELWPLFLWAAAVLLAVEMLLGRRSAEE